MRIIDWQGQELVTYGCGNKFIKKNFHPVVNRPRWNKPLGGLWASPVDSKWGWKDWCKSENFGDLETCFKFTLKKGVRVCIVDSLEDFDGLPTFDTSLGLTFLKNKLGRTVDFEEIARNADVIWLTEDGQRVTHFGRGINEMSLYGWDCETVLVLNAECVKPRKWRSLF